RWTWSARCASCLRWCDDENRRDAKKPGRLLRAPARCASRPERRTKRAAQCALDIAAGEPGGRRPRAGGVRRRGGETVCKMKSPPPLRGGGLGVIFQYVVAVHSD